MELRVLAVGDVVGEGGLDILSRRLPGLKEETGAHFAVVNGENASGVGITPAQARRILEAGADVITLGNHTWNRIQIGDFLDKEPRILRPAEMLVFYPPQQVLGCPIGDRISLSRHNAGNRQRKMGFPKAGVAVHENALAVRPEIIRILFAVAVIPLHDNPRIPPGFRIDHIGIVTEVKILKPAGLQRRRAV